MPLSGSEAYRVHRLLDELQLHTVCRQARCPNIGECFNHGTATFLILGDTCTRSCRFCAINNEKNPPPPALDEPWRVAEAALNMKLKHCVITGVNRDDLPDGGAGHYAQTVRQVRRLNPGITIEILPGDFSGSIKALKLVLDSDPDIFNHNLETVERLAPVVRDRRANYRVSLEMLRRAKELRPAMKTKSGLMVGLGETFDEVIEAMADLRAVNCDGITIGQYIPPSPRHFPLDRYWTPEEFTRLGVKAREMGFSGVASAPLVRSSYNAAEFFD